MASLSSSSSFLLLLCFIVLAKTGEILSLQASSDYSAVEMEMEEEELFGLFEVMGSLLEDPTWAKMHPQPCTETPWPGVQCEISAGTDDQNDQNYPSSSTKFHVTKIHLGPDILTPPCKTSATLSNSLLKLPFLKTLSLFNCFTLSPLSLPHALFGNFTSLEHLSLGSNPTLTGEIPSSVARIRTLKTLSLSQNSLHGEIPREIGSSLVNLEQLDLSYNNISGPIPGELGGLKSLIILDLSHNDLQRGIPPPLGELKCLQKLDFGSNHLRGRVPQEFGGLKALVLLDLSHNSLSGPLPGSLAGMQDLEYLNFEDNPINAGVPLSIGELKKLRALSFSRCGLNGTVPTNLGLLPNLEQLNLSQNQLCGELLFSKEFIQRLGKRLDVKGNNGLCPNEEVNYKKNNSSSSGDLHKHPSCLGSKDGNSRSGKEENPAEECEGVKASGDGYKGNYKSSNSQCLTFDLHFGLLASFTFWFIELNSLIL